MKKRALHSQSDSSHIGIFALSWWFSATDWRTPLRVTVIGGKAGGNWLFPREQLGCHLGNSAVVADQSLSWSPMQIVHRNSVSRRLRRSAASTRRSRAREGAQW